MKQPFKASKKQGFSPGDLCEFVPNDSGPGFMYELPVREIRDGVVCRPQIDDWSLATTSWGYCPLPADGPYIMLLVMRNPYDWSAQGARWAALYGDCLVEVYESELVRIEDDTSI